MSDRPSFVLMFPSRLKSTGALLPDSLDSGCRIFVDAGVEVLRFYATNSAGRILKQLEFPANDGMESLAAHIMEFTDAPLILTGKLRSAVKRQVGRGVELDSNAVLWLSASRRAEGKSTTVVDLSASGYAIAGVTPLGELKDDLLINSPRCGAGSGVNLDRVLQKLKLNRKQVDTVLSSMSGTSGAEKRKEIPVRADRCGVFAASATVSDKNQGLPIEFALATTLKSEVLKACKQIVIPFETVWLTGGVFRWQFCRDCAADYFLSIGILNVQYDQDQTMLLDGMMQMVLENRHLLDNDNDTRTNDPPVTIYPAFPDVRKRLEALQLYLRMPSGKETDAIATTLWAESVLLGIDIGSTMAKIVVSSSDGKTTLFKGSYSNAGDTIETLKLIFEVLRHMHVEDLQIVHIGLTGSARYQVRKALIATYPILADRITVLVENYAHALGSIPFVKNHLNRLDSAGIEKVNQDFFVLVDVGGEDTKISTVALDNGQLIDNAMNNKCSAGTGSLLDTLAALYGIPEVNLVAEGALAAKQAYGINATCSVFLLEHARRLQAEGYSRNEIMASAVWAIVENMARSLWNQIRFPANVVVLLHGQTMLSDPLPLAVAQRLQTYLDGPAFCLVPSDPGHRACFGLIDMLVAKQKPEPVSIPLAGLLEKSFDRRIITCHGVACGDFDARCYRSQLTAVDARGESVHFGLGGCAAINDLPTVSNTENRITRDTYRDIWQFAADQLPISDAPERLVIPRSFAVSEWARLFASLFEPVGIPVHVDVIRESDILRAQPHFHIDTCAPHIGVVGQFIRLSEQPHGMILAPQIEFLPIDGGSLGRTCTINQGGMAIACSIARAVLPESRFHLFYVDLKTTNPDFLAHKLHPRLLPVYEYYGIDVPFERFRRMFHEAMNEQQLFKQKVSAYAVDLAREALATGKDLALVTGREYILNPGVFDSHVGRLLRDKGLAGIPSYVLDIKCDPEYHYLYWRNAHLIATLSSAAAAKRVHKVVVDPAWRDIFHQIESQKDRLLPVVQVSTFLCGPDSVTNPLIDQLTNSRPYLRIQSDAAIKELAHLENRMNTYVKQLTETGRQRFYTETADCFDVRILDDLVNDEPLDPETDVICFPTLSDNRPILSVVRSAGFTCLENYHESFDLSQVIQKGRNVVGDTVCAPLAAVYGDILNAVDDFQARRQHDPFLNDKKRLLIFNSKGLGPCRQGQYVETHKLFMGRHVKSENHLDDGALVRFLIGHENKGFDGGFPRWVFWRGLQAGILQGVLHQLLADGAARCRNADEYAAFRNAFVELKEELNHLIEHTWAPGERALKLAGRIPGVLGLRHVAEYFLYGFYRNTLTPSLKRFHRKWCCQALIHKPLRFHIDGEAYMRTAQFEGLHEALLKSLGFGCFTLTYTPVWSFLEYKLAGMMMRAREGISESRHEMLAAHSNAFKDNRRRFMKKKQQQLFGVKCAHVALRYLLALPLYRAARVKMPEPMNQVLKVAKEVIPTRRPGGELIPYVGEAAIKLRKGYDLVLNVAPEGCMVSSMGEVLTPAIQQACPGATGKILPVFSQQGDVDDEQLQLALLKALGPAKLYGSHKAT